MTTLKTFCAWCGSEIRDEGDATSRAPGAAGHATVSHGICGSCAGDLFDVPVTDIYDLGTDLVDALPFGVLELAADGTVRVFNEAEARMSGLDGADVVGHDFFAEVAPCTRDTIVEERFRTLLARGGGDADITFVFRFRTGHRLVRIRMLVDPSRDRHLLLVQDEDGEPNPDHTAPVLSTG